jgi:uncharacterized protein YqjF (DUF2071 family)
LPLDFYLPTEMKKFLTAKWLDLVMANYSVDPSVLSEFVPEGTELDFWGGECFVSLVAFKFFETKVLGMPIPFHRNFLEVNLRFYVRRKAGNETRRGVVFIKEIVPRRAIAIIARYAYGEPYETWKMGLLQNESHLSYNRSKNGYENRLSVEIGENSGVPAEGSHGEFIIEHYWGYTKRGPGRTDEYKVEHPKWELFDVGGGGGTRVDVDFGRTYSEKFAFLSKQKPKSILVAKGSEIAVYKGAKLEINQS